jgi:hypothetical protein
MHNVLVSYCGRELFIAVTKYLRKQRGGKGQVWWLIACNPSYSGDRLERPAQAKNS